MNYFMKCYKHFKLVCRHKWYVFLASCEAGIPIRGFFHDISKFSPIEFFNSAKYYTGNRSPIDNEKDEKGYSLAWLHHRGRNPHHWEYWIDNLSDGGIALRIPYKYVKEMICDWIGAGKAYNKNNWTRITPLLFFNKKIDNDQIVMNFSTYSICKSILEDYAYNENKTLKQIFHNHNYDITEI